MSNLPAPPTRLLVRPKPKAFESLMGYLTRVAEANGYDKPTWLFDLAGMKQSFPTVPADPVPLAAKLGLEPQTLMDMCYWPVTKGVRERKCHFFGKEVPTFAVTDRRPKYCPECLKEHGYRLAIWDLVPLSYCPSHKRQLVDRCPKCFYQVGWSKAKVSNCLRCDHDLTDWPATACDRGALELSCFLLDGLDVPGYSGLGDPASFPILSHLSLDERLKVVIFLMEHKYSWNVGRGLGLQNMAQVTADALHQLMQKTAPALMNWPTGFHDYLAEMARNNAAGADHVGLANDFGNFYDHLTRFFDEDRFGFLHAAFNDFISHQWEGRVIVLGRTKRDMSAAPEYAYLSKKGAAERLGVRPETIERMIESGELTGKCRRMGSRNLHIIDIEAIRARELSSKDELTFQQASRLLGIGESAMRDLIDRNIVRPLRKAPLNRSRSMIFSKHHLDELLHRIVNSTRLNVTTSEELVVFPKAVRFLTSFQMTVADLIEWVLDGKIHVKGRLANRTSLRQCQFEQRDLTMLVAHLIGTPEGSRSLPQAADYLGLKQQVIYDLVEAGLLRTEKIMIRNRETRVIRDEALREFDKLYTPTKRICHTLGISARSLVDDLSDQGIRPVTGPSIDGARQYFFRRADIPSEYWGPNGP